MSAAVMVSVDPAAALGAGHAVVDELLAADYTAASDEELLDAFRQLERLRRRLAAVDSALIQEASARKLHETVHVRHLPGLLRVMLRIDPREAAGRVRAAEAAGERRALTGEVLAPLFPEVAAAQAAGDISAKHAQVITCTIGKLPDDVRLAEGPQVEHCLVQHARDWDPDNLAKLARRLLYCYDPDGAEPAEQLRQRNRDFSLRQRADGSSTAVIEATSELTEFLLTVFDANGAPEPAADGVKDPRTAGQRRHDALLEALKRLVRSEQLPSVNGVTATVMVTMTKQQYETGKGLARTSHGALVPVKEALRWGRHGADLRLLAVVTSDERPVEAYSTPVGLPAAPAPSGAAPLPSGHGPPAGGDPALLAHALARVKPVEAYSSSNRLFNETQRLVLQAVHGGCTFPNCSEPPGRCQAHHTIDYAAGGPTDVNLAAPVCGYDHRERIAQGWVAVVIGPRVGWLPPPFVDPEQRPRFNNLHDPWRSAQTEAEHAADAGGRDAGPGVGSAGAGVAADGGG